MKRVREKRNTNEREKTTAEEGWIPAGDGSLAVAVPGRNQYFCRLQWLVVVLVCDVFLIFDCFWFLIWFGLCWLVFGLMILGLELRGR
jgi:hypothetical protein